MHPLLKSTTYLNLYPYINIGSSYSIICIVYSKAFAPINAIAPRAGYPLSYKRNIVVMRQYLSHRYIIYACSLFCKLRVPLTFENLCRSKMPLSLSVAMISTVFIPAFVRSLRVSILKREKAAGSLVR
jgi:hypothetical protein